MHSRPPQRAHAVPHEIDGTAVVPKGQGQGLVSDLC